MLSLVPYLLERGEVTVDEVAGHFDVSPELVRKSVALLPMVGVPGESKQYLPNDLFDIDWDALDDGVVILLNNVVIDETPRFTTREAAALIAGLQYLSALPENVDSEAIAALKAKLARGAIGTPGQVAVDGAEPDDALGLIRAAIGSGTQLLFDYRNARGDTERRRVDALRVDARDTDWYLRAWDHGRQAVRTFRLDRMLEVLPSSEPMDHPDVAIPDALFEASPDDIEVVVELPASALPLLADYGPEGTEPGSRDGSVRASLRLAHLTVLQRLVTGYAGVVTVVGPPDARSAVAEWAAQGSARYGE